MNPHPLAQIAPPAKTSVTVKCGSESLTFQRPATTGDVVMQLLYPNPIEVSQIANHAARVNGRKPYSPSSVEYALAILATLATPDACEPVDITTILAVYDSDPALWQTLVNAALEVLGLQDDQSHLCGEVAWETLFHKLTQIRQTAQSPLVNEALSLCRIALATYREPSQVEQHTPLDGQMEAQLGN